MKSASETISPMPPGLAYVSDQSPGIGRKRGANGFVYHHADGRRVSDAQQLERMRHLAIPPAYTSVWICPSPRGHLQATGRDARGRKQYVYHPHWRTVRDETKFERMTAFGAALPRIRSRVQRDLDMPVDKEVLRTSVLAAVVRLLDTTLVRVGNDEYARANGSFGLTTLRKRHTAVKSSALRLRFRGKSGVSHEVAVHDRRVMRIVRRCQALPGQELFQYLDCAGEAHGINSMDVNAYLREAAGGEFTAKDFRTWHGSVIALQLWRQLGAAEQANATAAQAHRLIAQVASRLGNTVAVCRKSYIHPRVMVLMRGAPASTTVPGGHPPPRKAGLTLQERDFLALLTDPSRRVAS